MTVCPANMMKLKILYSPLDVFGSAFLGISLQVIQWVRILEWDTQSNQKRAAVEDVEEKYFLQLILNVCLVNVTQILYQGRSP